MIIRTERDIDDLAADLRHRLKTETDIHVMVKKATLSPKQFGALHLYCHEIAELLNAHGINQSTFYANVKGGGFDWNKDSVKNGILKPIIKAMFDLNSTTKIKKREQVDDLVMNLSRFFSERLGVEIPAFPSRDRMLWESTLEQYETEKGD